MFLVEYIQVRKKQKFKYCEGFYDKDSAMDFALKLNTCANVDLVTVSEIDISFADVIYESEEKCLIQ